MPVDTFELDLIHFDLLSSSAVGLSLASSLRHVATKSLMWLENGPSEGRRGGLFFGISMMARICS